MLEVLTDCEQMWLWSCAFTDVFITFSLTIALRKRIAGFNSSTDSVLRKLIFVAVETASYTAVFALLGGETLCASGNEDVG